MKIKKIFFLGLSLILFLPNISLAVPLYNPLGTTKTFPALVSNVISGILGVVGAIALVMMVIGGITWMTSAGNIDRVKRGRDTLLWAILGLVVIFLSYAIVRFVFISLGAQSA